MERTPFPYSGPLEADEVTGRDAEAAELVRLLGGRVPVALVAPRRYGKTSLLRRAVWLLDQVEPTTTVWLDLYGLSSVADFAVRLDRALSTTVGRFREALDRIAGGLSINVGVVSAELRRSARSAPDPTATVHALLDSLTRAAEHHPTVLVIDEVADAIGVGNVLEVLRTHLQPVYRDLGLAFAGSRPTMMTRLFADSDQPLYSQARRMELGPLPAASVVEVVHRGFAATGRGAGPVAAEIARFGAGHPQRSMELADAAWWLTDPGTEADRDTWETTLATVRARSAPALREFFGVLSGTQQAVLRAVVRTGAPFAASEGRFHDLSNSSITIARDALVDAGHLIVGAGGTVVTDPLLADWIARELP
ncbi:MAG TPA: AAA family ATPase [Microthrixaceae bacterium]|nr:AAA family ATPase [Microthrixaceae bacterium]